MRAVERGSRAAGSIDGSGIGVRRCSRAEEVPSMVIRMAPWTFAVALTLLTVAPVGAEDVIPPRLTCVDGLFSRSIPIPGEHLRLRRWLCDVDGQANSGVRS